MISGGLSGAYIVLFVGMLLVILGLLFAPTGVGIAVALLGLLLISIAIYTIFSSPGATGSNCSYNTCYSNCLNMLLGSPLRYLLSALGVGGAYGAGSIPIMGLPAMELAGAAAGAAIGAYLGADAAAAAAAGAANGGLFGASLLANLGYAAAIMGGWGIGTLAGCAISCGLNSCNY